MTSKIIAGSLMLVPAFAAHALYIAHTNQQSMGSSILKCGKYWISGLGLALVFGTGWVGLLHLCKGVYQASPQICSRINWDDHYGREDPL